MRLLYPLYNYLITAIELGVTEVNTKIIDKNISGAKMVNLLHPSSQRPDVTVASELLLTTPRALATQLQFPYDI